MNFIIEHILPLATLAGLLVTFGTVVTGWSRMGFRLTKLEEDVLKNRQVLKDDVSRVVDLVDACKTEHAPCRDSIITHHQNMLMHISPQERELTGEWREDVIKRLGSIEKLLWDIKRNGDR